MATSTALTSTGEATPAIRFHLNLADRTETEAVDRYVRSRRLANDVLDAARRAEARMRLEFALTRMPAGSHPA